jgi:nucleoside 2-deoxyribosyltransferase
MKKIYIAGPLRAKDWIESIKNTSRLMQESENVRLNGFAVYCPATDILLGLKFGDYDINDYFENSIEFLKVCDAVFITGDWVTSVGCQKELEIAYERGIPVFDKIEDLKDYFRNYHPKYVELDNNDETPKSEPAPDEIETIVDGFLGLPKGSRFKINDDCTKYEYSWSDENSSKQASFSFNLLERNEKFFKVVE